MPKMDKYKKLPGPEHERDLRATVLNPMVYRAVLSIPDCRELINLCKGCDPTTTGDHHPDVWRFWPNDMPPALQSILGLYADSRGVEHQGMNHPVRILRYREGDKVLPHMDYKTESVRKVSMSLQLNARTEYRGDLEIMTDEGYTAFPVEQGDAVVYPGYLMHRVSVTVGTRWSLACWLTGNWK